MGKVKQQELTVSDSLLQGAAPDIIRTQFSSDGRQREKKPVPREMELTIYINSEELVTILCTPTKLTPLVLGFLYSEGIIAGKEDVSAMRVCAEDSLADVKLSKSGFVPPERRILTSGCGGGVSFTQERQRVDSDLFIAPEDILWLMKQLNQNAELYRFCGGVHTSALGNSNGLIAIAEDIGRHNTLDKIMGECLITGQKTGDKLLLTTGRISSEMLSKALKMETPIVVSRSSPTDRAISLARELGITLVGYVRGNRLSVYTHEERVKGAGDSELLNQSTGKRGS
jgi:FdhD protein